jgi:hypothetical protein
MSYTWKAYHCELCKTEVPEKICIQECSFTLYDLQRPQSNYLIIESIQLASADLTAQ